MKRQPKRGLSEKAVTIYTLTNPITGQIFYVGRTTLNFNRRLNAAAANKKVESYINKLRKKGHSPVIEPLDCCSYERRKDVEEYWIQQIAAWGFCLLNTKHYVNKNAGPHVARNTRLSEEEKAIIDILYRFGDNTAIANRLGMSDEIVRFYKKRITIPKRIKDAVVGYYNERARIIAEWYLKNQQLKAVKA